MLCNPDIESEVQPNRQQLNKSKIIPTFIYFLLLSNWQTTVIRQNINVFVNIYIYIYIHIRTSLKSDPNWLLSVCLPCSLWRLAVAKSNRSLFICFDADLSMWTQVLIIIYIYININIYIYICVLFYDHIHKDSRINVQDIPSYRYSLMK